MIVCFATNDGEHLIMNHFGDAKVYDLYEINNDSIERVVTVLNTVEETEVKKEKAENIMKLLKSHGGEVLVNRAFGTNIQNVAKKLLPMIIREDKISDAANVIQKHYGEIKEVLENQSSVFMTYFPEVNQFKVTFINK